MKRLVPQPTVHTTRIQQVFSPEVIAFTLGCVPVYTEEGFMGDGAIYFIEYPRLRVVGL